ncbi:hypothetical protein Pcinc_026518, partial [Petrolisthes cinctipes]
CLIRQTDSEETDHPNPSERDQSKGGKKPKHCLSERASISTTPGKQASKDVQFTPTILKMSKRLSVRSLLKH